MPSSVSTNRRYQVVNISTLCVIVLVTALVYLYWSGFSRLIPTFSFNLQNDLQKRAVIHGELSNATRHKVCMLFDWPPWTRSSVIAHALKKCWEEKLGFFIMQGNSSLPMNRQNVVKRMVEQRSAYVAAVGGHMEIFSNEVELVQALCDHTFYVTSTRTILDRVVLYIKSALLKSRKVANDAVRLSDETKREVEDMTQSGEVQVLMGSLEEYPFTDKKSLSIDYVVRNNKFSIDLLALLEAFNCNDDNFIKASMDSSNLFADEHGVEDMIDSTTMVNYEEFLSYKQGEIVPSPSPSPQPFTAWVDKFLHEIMELDDRKHLLLGSLGWRRNSFGLQKAKEIVALRFNKEPYMPFDDE